MEVIKSVKFGLEIWIVAYRGMYITEFLSEYKAIEYSRHIANLLNRENVDE